MKSISVIVVVLIIGLFASCNKDQSDSTKFNNGILRWTGEYATCGCGFFISINEHDYKPENENNIDDNFKTNEEIQVILEYEELHEKIGYSCGDSPHAFYSDGIKIISIKKI